MKRRIVISGLGLLTGSACLYQLVGLHPKLATNNKPFTSTQGLPQWDSVESLVSDIAADHDLFELFEAPSTTSNDGGALSIDTIKQAGQTQEETIGQDDGLIAQEAHELQNHPSLEYPNPNGNIDSMATSAKDKNAIRSHKSRHFNNEFHDDMMLQSEQIPVMTSVLQRLKRCQTLVGFGNFNIIGFDKCLHYARNYSEVGAFTAQELAFIDSVFSRDAGDYGFFGDRVSNQLTDTIIKKDVIKIPHTGHFLYQGESEKYYQRLLNEVGPGLTLTSGIRSNVKQLYLFLSKTAAANYNLSKASRSLAPPGYSFHGIGDFDVGKKGWGWANFSDQFASTKEFKKLLDLGYVQIRYNRDNTLGVRFEPWHIKVV